VPELNGHWIDGGFRPAAGIHVGCAISLRGGGLVAPALPDADQMDLTALMRKLTDLVARARAGSLKSSELSDPTITVTNLGDQGVEATFGIIYPVALVGFGKVAERPWVASGKIEARSVLTATLSADHRATDGHRGGLFLTTVDRTAANAREAITRDEIKSTVVDALTRVAPEIDPASIQSSVSFRDQLDLDSMDFLNFVLALHERLGVDIPEVDYPRLYSLDSAVAYLASKGAAGTDKKSSPVG
jgi:acyl carrier protein